MIPRKEWLERNSELLDVSKAAYQYPNSPLNEDEIKRYAEFVEASMDLVDEEYPPSFINTGDRDKDRESIRWILTISIKAWRLKRLLPLMNPSTALRVADTIARIGSDKKFWK